MVTHPEQNCCNKFYRSVVSDDMNIGLTKLGSEQCEACVAYGTVKAGPRDHEPMECEKCREWKRYDIR